MIGERTRWLLFCRWVLQGVALGYWLGRGSWWALLPLFVLVDHFAFGDSNVRQRSS